MKHNARLALTALSFALLTTTSFAQAQSRNARPPADSIAERQRAARNARFEAALAAEHPALVADFHRAGELEDTTAALAAIDRVIAGAPQFGPALARRCALRVQRNEFDQAQPDCVSAVALDDSDAHSLHWLARWNLRSPEHREGRDLDRAHDNIATARMLAPDELTIIATQCQIGLTNIARQQGIPGVVQTGAQDLADCSRAFDRVDPDSFGAHYFRVFAALVREDYAEASRSIDEIEATQNDPQTVAQLRAAVREATPWHVTARRVLAPTFALWLFGGLALFIAAAMLNRRTLQAAERETTSDLPTIAERKLRSLYRAVLTLCGAYYYLSIPMLVLTALSIAALFAFAVLEAGRVPIKAVIIVGGGVLFTLQAIAKGVSATGDDADPGERLELAKHPKLAALLRDAAARSNTRVVDTVFLTSGTEVAVFERGSFFAQWRGTAERCLVLGAGLLDTITVAELRAVLAHEYGHFRNEDTAGGNITLAARRSLATMLIEMRRSGVASGFNPVWWFVAGYFHVFMRVSQGASRLQEILADRVAAKACGSATFERGLRAVIAQSVRFSAHCNAALREVVNERRAIVNLYTHAVSANADAAALEREIDAEIHRESGPLDSHPSPIQRFEAVRALGFEAPSQKGDDEHAWTLFTHRDALERSLTERFRTMVHASTGIAIPSEASAT